MGVYNAVKNKGVCSELTENGRFASSEVQNYMARVLKDGELPASLLPQMVKASWSNIIKRQAELNQCLQAN